MKELSIEEKAKAYDEAVINGSRLWESDIITRESYEYIFPELAESEDERIRRFIKDVLDSYGRSIQCPTKDILLCEKAHAWIENQGKNNMGISETTKQKLEDNLNKALEKETTESWNKFLEKQIEKGTNGNKREIPNSEQKPADKVEPKFHKGEWIVHRGTENIYQVVAVIDNQYQLKYGDNYTIQKCTDVDRCTRLWDIAKDAKTGDMLCDGTTIFIFKDWLSDDSVMSYCDYDTNSGESDAFCPLSVNLMCSKITPATKEQRDTLEKAMADAGYEWNAEKKELKKIEQKPAEWSEEDEGFLNLLLAVFTNEHPNGIFSTGDISVFKGNLVTSNRIIEWLKSLRPQPTWKPSDKQMKALHDLNLTGGISYIGQGQELINLYNNLKKLKG